jgi:hypothetical protein
MELIRLFLIIVVLLIFSYVFYKLLKERAIIIQGGDPATLEGMSIQDEIRKLNGKGSGITIQNMNPKRIGLPLREYCIKSSYNSAYTGSKISGDMLRYILSRGCRFIDLQIHYSEKDDVAYVANITDQTKTEMNSENRVPLDTIFNVIAANAFSTTQGKNGSPNPDDPLFLHMRIVPDKNGKVYDAVADCIKQSFSDSFRFLNNAGNANKIDKYTQINNKIMKKAVFLIDKTYNPEYAYFSQKIANMINGETGGSTFQTFDYSKMKNKLKTPPIIKDDYRTTNILEEKIVMPEILERYSNPSIINMVVNHGIQITLYSFYKSDDKLTQYEDLFNEYKSAIIPMAYAINYLGKMDIELAEKTIQIGALA